MNLNDEAVREARMVMLALKREVELYGRLRNSIWFGVKINGIVLMLVMVSTGIHAAIYWMSVP